MKPAIIISQIDLEIDSGMSRLLLEQSATLEAVRAAAGRTIDIDVVNRVLLQPHWQNQVDLTDF